MAFVMAIGSEVIGECVEGIRVEVRREVLRVVLVYPGSFPFGAQCLIGSVVRLRGVQWCQVSEAVWGWLRVDEEIKSPCNRRGSRCLGSVCSSHRRHIS